MDELVGGDVDLDGELDLAALLAQDVVEGLGLGAVAREAVEDDALRRIALGEPVQEHPDGDVVGHELAAVHVAARLQPDRRAVADGGPEQVARRDVRQPEVPREGRRLGPLAGAREPPAGR